MHGNRSSDSTPGSTRRRSLLGTGILTTSAMALGFDAHASGPEPALRRTKEMIKITVERVQFESGGDEVVGLLFKPVGVIGALPAVIILGPFGFVKEQSPVQYATRLAHAGFVTLIFDPRHSGESGGSPRRHESPASKIEDAGAAISWLAERKEVDRMRMAALGICQGCSEMIAVSAAEPRIGALALVSGQYLYRENIEKFFAGGGPDLDQRIARGRLAKKRFDTAGLVDYNEVVSVRDKACALPWPPIHDWYMPWTTQKWGAPSRWENRYTTMSDAEVWTFDVDAHARALKTPTLIVHGDQSDGGPEAARHVYALLASEKKQLEIVPGVFHTRFYDDPLVIEPAAESVIDWFRKHVS